MTKNEALKMAIEYIDKLKTTGQTNWLEINVIQNACKEALEQPEQENVLPNNRWSKENELIESWKQPAQEPVGYIQEESPNGKGFFATYLPMKDMKNKPVYIHPAPSWQGLSDDEKLAIIRKWKDAHTMREQELIGLGDAIEQALKEKNHG